MPYYRETKRSLAGGITIDATRKPDQQERIPARRVEEVRNETISRPALSRRLRQVTLTTPRPCFLTHHHASATAHTRSSCSFDPSASNFARSNPVTVCLIPASSPISSRAHRDFDAISSRRCSITTCSPIIRSRFGTRYDVPSELSVAKWSEPHSKHQRDTGARQAIFSRSPTLA